MRDVAIDISNVMVQYEDADGSLGCGHVTLGVRIGKVLAERHHGRFLKCEAMRIGVFAETSNRRFHNFASDPRAQDVFNTWRPHLGKMLENDPQKVAAELRRFNNVERYRLWAFEALDQKLTIFERILAADKYYNLAERSPESRLICSLLKVSLQAGPESSWVDATTQEEASEDPSSTCVENHPEAHPGQSSSRTFTWVVSATASAIGKFKN